MNHTLYSSLVFIGLIVTTTRAQPINSDVKTAEPIVLYQKVLASGDEVLVIRGAEEKSPALDLLGLQDIKEIVKVYSITVELRPAHGAALVLGSRLKWEQRDQRFAGFRVLDLIFNSGSAILVVAEEDGLTVWRTGIVSPQVPAWTRLDNRWLPSSAPPPGHLSNVSATLSRSTNGQLVIDVVARRAAMTTQPVGRRANFGGNPADSPMSRSAVRSHYEQVANEWNFKFVQREMTPVDPIAATGPTIATDPRGIKVSEVQELNFGTIDWQLLIRDDGSATLAYSGGDEWNIAKNSLDFRSAFDELMASSVATLDGKHDINMYLRRKSDQARIRCYTGNRDLVLRLIDKAVQTVLAQNPSDSIIGFMWDNRPSQFP